MSARIFNLATQGEERVREVGKKDILPLLLLTEINSYEGAMSVVFFQASFYLKNRVLKRRHFEKSSIDSINKCTMIL